MTLTDRAGTVTISESESNWQENAVNQKGGSTGISVLATTLDDLCEKEGINSVNFLKINIEGAERDALLGMESVIPRIRQICVACYDFRYKNGDGEQFRTRAFVEPFLIEHGFTLTWRSNDPRDFVRDHVFGLRHG